MTLTTTIMRRGIDAKKAKRVSDNSVKGFGVRFNTRGEAYFMLRYQSPVTARDTSYVIGKYGKDEGQMLISGARARAKSLRSLIESGKDLQAIFNEEKNVTRLNGQRDVTIKTLSARYANSVRNDVRFATFKEKKLVLARLSDAYGDEDIHNFKRIEALALLDNLEEQYGKGASMKQIAHCSAFWNWALEEGYTETANPWANMKARKKRYRAKAKTRWLDDSELRHFITDVYPTLPSSIQRASLISLYTNCRSGMASSTVTKGRVKIGIDWLEIKWEREEWTLSSERMKAHNEHVVPYPRQLAGLLRSWWQEDGEPEEGPIVSAITSKNKYLDSSVYAENFSSQDYSPHDFRRTVSTQLQRMNCPFDIREALRAHIDRSGIASVYDIHDYLPERREWLQRWADHLDTLGFDNVVLNARQDIANMRVIK